MPTEQIHRSDEAAEFIGVAELTDHKLDFTRFAKSRQCGVADVVASSGDSVWGVVWKVNELGMSELDVREGVKYDSYKREPVVVLINGMETECTTYVVVDKKPFIPPSSEYVGLIIDGAREHQLPATYVEMLNKVPISK